MSFSMMSTALSSLNSQRLGLDVTAQNIANANTTGYTRQRAELQSASTASVASIHSGTMMATGNGVNVVGLTRLDDAFLDARLRTETSNAAQTAALASTLSKLEGIVPEPSDSGVSVALQEFWTAWSDVANSPDSTAARTVLMGTAETLSTQIADTYNAFESQWNQARAEADAFVSQVNTTAESIANLNQQIRAITVSGGSANELMDQRDLLITELSELTGAVAQPQSDGTITVLIGGNPIVQADKANAIEVTGSYTMSAAIADPPGDNAIGLQWAGSGNPVDLDGGTLSGTLHALQPASNGGPIAAAVNEVNALATELAAQVNAIHSTGYTLADPPNDTGVDFFELADGVPPALGLKVAFDDPKMVAAGNGVDGDYDGSIADQISQISTAKGSPDELWKNFVVDLGVQTQSAVRRAEVAEATRSTAEAQHLSNASVDVDEEMVNMMAYQRAYEGAARVLTTVDEMLDVLINRTGVVGR